MDDIEVRLESSEPSEDRSDRVEELWSQRHDEFLKKMLADCGTASTAHANTAARCRHLYKALALPSAILPLVATFGEDALGAPMPVIRALMLGASGLSAAAGVLNLGSKAKAHEQYAGLYHDLGESIEYTLTRSKASREACDVTMQKLLAKRHLLTASAPPL